MSVQTARAAETIQDMHYCDATKTGTDRSRRSDAAVLRALATLASIFGVHCRSLEGGRKEHGQTQPCYVQAILASIFDVKRRSQGRGEEGTWVCGGGGIWYTTTRMNYNNNNNHNYAHTHGPVLHGHPRSATNATQFDAAVPRRTVTLTAVLLLSTVEDTHSAKGHSLVLLFTQQSTPRWLQGHDSYGSRHL